ncbi:MAG: hypothetical protein ACTSRS_06610 [Candidatus Helarchaeota archaeon]
MSESLIADLDFWLLWMCVLVFFLYGTFFLKKYREAEETQAKFYFGLALFCICFAFMRISFLLYDLKYYFVEPEFFWRVAAILGIGAVIFILFVIERYMVKTHYILSLITSIGLVIALIFPVTPIGRTATYIFTPIGVLGIIGLYVYLIKNSSGIIRMKTFLALLGILIIFIGYILDTNLFQTILPLSIEEIGIITSIIMMFGGLIFVQGYRMRQSF